MRNSHRKNNNRFVFENSTTSPATEPSSTVLAVPPLNLNSNLVDGGNVHRSKSMNVNGHIFDGMWANTKQRTAFDDYNGNDQNEESKKGKSQNTKFLFKKTALVNNQMKNNVFARSLYPKY